PSAESRARVDYREVRWPAEDHATSLLALTHQPVEQLGFCVRRVPRVVAHAGIDGEAGVAASLPDLLDQPFRFFDGHDLVRVTVEHPCGDAGRLVRHEQPRPRPADRRHGGETVWIEAD